MSDHYDRIAASAPVNATAAKVTGRGSEWNPAIALQDWYPDQPPTMRARGDGPQFVDYTGVKVGRLVVVGMMVKESTNRKSSWVCRCTCGCFCTRTSKSLKVGLAGGNTFFPECGRCDYQHRLQRGWTPELKNKPKVKA